MWGGTLGYLFGNDQKSGGENMDALNAAISKKFDQTKAAEKEQFTLLSAELTQQGLALTALGNQLSGITTALSQITGVIANLEQMLQAISQQQLYTSWQAIDSQITNHIASIDAAFSTYSDYIADFRKTSPESVRDLVSDILSVNVGPKAGLDAIHDFMVGGGQARGALELWSEMVAPLVQNGNLDYRNAVQQYKDYYQKLAYAQLRATNLVMEAYNFRGDTDQAKKTWTQYKQHLLAQEEPFLTWLIPLVYSGVLGGTWASQTVLGGEKFHNINFTCFDASLQLNPNAQCVRGDTDIGNAFYTPSSIFMSAEQLLANLYVTGASDRRVVVHMTYPNGLNIPSLLDGLKLTLSKTGSPTPILPTSGNRLGAPFPFPPPASEWNPDVNFYTGNGFYLKRYLFNDDGGITDGTYQLTDLNGGNLPPITVYDLKTTPFQSNSVVNYVLRLDPVNRFDFMNFNAYSAPALSACIVPN